MNSRRDNRERRDFSVPVATPSRQIESTASTGLVGCLVDDHIHLRVCWDFLVVYRTFTRVGVEFRADVTESVLLYQMGSDGDAGGGTVSARTKYTADQVVARPVTRRCPSAFSVSLSNCPFLSGLSVGLIEISNLAMSVGPGPRSYRSEYRAPPAATSISENLTAEPVAR